MSTFDFEIVFLVCFSFQVARLRVIFGWRSDWFEENQEACFQWWKLFCCQMLLYLYTLFTLSILIYMFLQTCNVWEYSFGILHLMLQKQIQFWAFHQEHCSSLYLNDATKHIYSNGVSGQVNITNWSYRYLCTYILEEMCVCLWWLSGQSSTLVSHLR